jgi:hypothetical protein
MSAIFLILFIYQNIISVDKRQAEASYRTSVKFGREVQKLLISYHQVHELLQNKVEL